MEVVSRVGKGVELRSFKELRDMVKAKTSRSQ